MVSEIARPRALIVIAVMGITGTGKSTFIHNVTQQDVVIGTGIESQTQEVAVIKTILEGKEVWFIDTPGFDDTHRTDAQVLDQVGSCLGSNYADGVKINGVIYLHRITDNRMQA